MATKLKEQLLQSNQETMETQLQMANLTLRHPLAAALLCCQCCDLDSLGTTHCDAAYTLGTTHCDAAYTLGTTHSNAAYSLGTTHCRQFSAALDEH